MLLPPLPSSNPPVLPPPPLMDMNDTGSAARCPLEHLFGLPPTSPLHVGRAAPVRFADVLLARPAMDVCVVLASERCYMVSVDEALSEENERAGLGLLLMQGGDGDHDAIGLDVHMLLSPAMTGEVLSRHVSHPSLASSPLLTGHEIGRAHV